MPISKPLVQFIFCVLVTVAIPASASDYVDTWGPTVGEALPLLEAYDQAGQLRTLENLVGGRGLLLSLNRSADW